MNQEEITALAEKSREKAQNVISQSGIADVWKAEGCRVNLVGSLRMGLLGPHRDIDFHVYSAGITEEISFAIAAKIARIPGVKEIRCINGLGTEEHCVAWHIFYEHEGEIWQFDIIHIEEGTRFDGYFERMADRIVTVMTADQRKTILRLKFETPAEKDYHGVEYYEAVIADDVATISELEKWVAVHRKQTPYYWIP